MLDGCGPELPIQNINFGHIILVILKLACLEKSKELEVVDNCYKIGILESLILKIEQDVTNFERIENLLLATMRETNLSKEQILAILRAVAYGIMEGIYPQ